MKKLLLLFLLIPFLGHSQGILEVKETLELNYQVAVLKLGPQKTLPNTINTSVKINYKQQKVQVITAGTPTYTFNIVKTKEGTKKRFGGNVRIFGMCQKNKDEVILGILHKKAFILTWMNQDKMEKMMIYGHSFKELDAIRKK